MGQAITSAAIDPHTIVYGFFPALRSEDNVLGTTHHGYNPRSQCRARQET